MSPNSVASGTPIAFCLLLAAFGAIQADPKADPKRFENVYAKEMDKQMRELFAMGFKCKIVLDFAHPLCVKCCEHHDMVATEGPLKANCDCKSREELDVHQEAAAVTTLPSETEEPSSIGAPDGPKPTGPAPWPMPPPPPPPPQTHRLPPPPPPPPQPPSGRK